MDKHEANALFDACHKFSDIIHTQARIQEINRAVLRWKCGDCRHWMIKAQCPYEAQRVVTSGDPTCGKFVVTGSSAKWRQDMLKECADLTARLSAMTTPHTGKSE